MKTLEVDQALYGYENGHRLLATSRPIDAVAGRVLRAVSDMAFDGLSRSYLTVLPIKDLKAQAFIRTWPASDAVRPGSVWSHVLLVDFVDLGQLDGFADVVASFQHPMADKSRDAQWMDAFKVPLKVQIRSARLVGEADKALLRRLLALIYASDAPVSVVEDIRKSERALVTILEQQWPRLRRAFSFRTRSRSSANPTFRFDVEVVEHTRSPTKPVIGADDWVEVLAADLSHPESDFRPLLRTFGAESTDGRRDVPGLVRVISSARTEKATHRTVDEICRAFPDPGSMAKLKRALLGPPGQTPRELRAWPRGDLDRLELLLTRAYSCLDFGDLDLAGRLERAWQAHPAELSTLLAQVPATELTHEQLNIIVMATATTAPPRSVAQLAAQGSELVPLVLHEEPSLLRIPEFWAVESVVPQLLESFSSADRVWQVATLTALVDSGSSDAAARAYDHAPDLWWDTFLSLTEVDLPGDLETLLARAKTLQEVLDVIDRTSIGPSPKPLQTDAVLTLLALLADTVFLRHAPAEIWVHLAENAAVKRGKDCAADTAASRIDAVALNAASKSRRPSLRRRAWLATFSQLHRALAASDPDPNTWSLVRDLVPRNPEWDRCSRLRHAAIESMVRDRWSAEEVERLLKALPEHRKELANSLRKREEKKKKSRGWLLDLIDDMLR